MIENLKNLQPGDMITIDDDAARVLTSNDDFTIKKIQCHACDGEDIIIVCLDGYSLVGSTLSGNILFAICEQYDEGDGYFDKENGCFLETINLLGGEGSISYRATTEGVYSESEYVPSFCEYEADDYFNFILAEKTSSSILIRRGFTIPEHSIVI